MVFELRLAPVAERDWNNFEAFLYKTLNMYEKCTGQLSLRATKRDASFVARCLTFVNMLSDGIN